ncbi:T-cell immunoglobulin and mucin domain-containing protein 4 [Egretta garzetta]|uniref:T-cell immunoglobulin and mucin domain-containing protein 4 n=1 Tax=Egretta garzetta TaxID=188379 RepID=UPI00163BEE32|nr:T-cell immunoglobulin and mucin domain-containing protein 4 [Egretta garzetta]
MSHFVLFHWIMIQIFIAHTASQTVIRGVIGQPVQLPCFYHVTRRKDISDMCWGRGPCPNSKCNNKILHTTGTRVTFRKSQRYSLQGYVSYGDVSLTIGKVKAEDAGTYCCRIEIPGWFNDIKKNMQLEVVRAPPVMTTTTRKAPVSPKSFRKPTSAPQSTSDHHTTAEITTAVLLTTAVPEATSASIKSPAVITVETNALPTFAVTANDTFPATIVTTSALPDFPTGFQTTDMRTKDDDVFCSAESVPLPGDTEVTTEFPSALLTAEGIKSAHPSLVVEDVLTVATTPPMPTMLQTPERTLAPSRISSNSDIKDEKHNDNGDKFPSYSILIACVIVVSILFILMLSSLFWKRGHTKKFIIKSLGPVEDIEKVFSDAEGENSIFSL